MKIVFVGNFDCVFSTESHHLWTWRKLGHDVVPLQQNRTNEQAVLDACRDAQLLQVTHTHDWPSPLTMQTVQRVREMGVKSFSYHLDKYIGLPARMGRYFEHPSFHLDAFFSTDGGPTDALVKSGIVHKFIPPGIVEYVGYIADDPGNTLFDLRFFGSVSYHHEYKYRPQMVADLKANYGNRFEIVTGVREDPLNRMMAQTRVTVGDHIFAGQPAYWSDRLPESAGRGAFIIYPDVPGLEEYKKHGLITYRPQDSSDLINKIDYYLDIGHESDRIERRNSVHEYVKKTQTYTVHLSRILEIMGF